MKSSFDKQPVFWSYILRHYFLLHKYLCLRMISLRKMYRNSDVTDDQDCGYNLLPKMLEVQRLDQNSLQTSLPASLSDYFDNLNYFVFDHDVLERRLNLKVNHQKRPKIVYKYLKIMEEKPCSTCLLRLRYFSNWFFIAKIRFERPNP